MSSKIKTKQQTAKQSQKTKSRKVNAPIAKGDISYYGPPKFHQTSPGCIKVSKSEYISEIIPDVNPFAVVLDMAINAASKSAFPWLSGIAALYETYKFAKLVYEYKTQSPTTQEGYVAMAVDYNVNDLAPTNKTDMFEMQSTVRSPVWEDVKHVSTSKNLNKRKGFFTLSDNARSQLSAAPEDPNLYDVGRLIVAAGNNGSAVAGELWVHYEVELSTPQHTNGDNEFVSQQYLYENTAIGTLGQYSPFGNPIFPTLRIGGPDNALFGTTKTINGNSTWAFVVQPGFEIKATNSGASLLTSFGSANNWSGAATPAARQIAMGVCRNGSTIGTASIMEFQDWTVKTTSPSEETGTGYEFFMVSGPEYLVEGDCIYFINTGTYTVPNSCNQYILFSCLVRNVGITTAKQGTPRFLTPMWRKTLAQNKLEEDFVKVETSFNNGHKRSLIR